jgi:hypothetical protein
MCPAASFSWLNAGFFVYKPREMTLVLDLAAGTAEPPAWHREGDNDG